MATFDINSTGRDFSAFYEPDNIFSSGHSFNARFNNQTYEMEMYLDNTIQTIPSQYYILNPNAVVSLQIEDTLADWVTRGAITILYSSLLGSDTKTSTGQSAPVLQNYTAPTAYVFRNDGFDLLRIFIRPKFREKVQGTITADHPDWALSYLFSITDVEEVSEAIPNGKAGSTSLKCLKLRFHDYWYQLMSTDVQEYSTALSENADTATGELLTGLAMKEVIQQSLGYSRISGAALDMLSKITREGSGKVADGPAFTGFKGNDSIASDWESGGKTADDKHNRIFYTSPAGSTAYENLMYIYSCHIGNVVTAFGKDVNDISIITRERGAKQTDLGKMSLKSVSKYFERAQSDYFQERYFIQGFSNGSLLAVSRTPKNKKVQFEPTTKYHQINSFKFIDMAAEINSNLFIQRAVHSIDFKNRRLRIEFQNNSPKAARDFMVKYYTNEKNMLMKGKPEDCFLVNIDAERGLNRNVLPVFSLYGGEEEGQFRQIDGLHELLRIGLFQNTAISFRVLGLPLRQSGFFISIDYPDGAVKSDYTDRLCGQWFVLSVVHMFEAGIYINEITAVKLYRYDKLDKKLNYTI